MSEDSTTSSSPTGDQLGDLLYPRTAALNRVIASRLEDIANEFNKAADWIEKNDPEEAYLLDFEEDDGSSIPVSAWLRAWAARLTQPDGQDQVLEPREIGGG